MKAQVKYRAIWRHKGKYPVEFMCQFFEVSRSGYYSCLKRKNKPAADKSLADMIAQCQEHSKKTYGYRRVHIWLMRKGIYLNLKTVLRIMLKYDLLSQIRRTKKYRFMGQHIHRYKNLMNRNFTSNRPDEKWVTDISYIHTSQGVLYLSIIRDLYDNSIVAYKTATSQSTKLVLDTIKQAQRKRAVAGELQLHSDQGFQYTSHAYFTLTKDYGITQSMSRRANCFDNAMAENFFSTLKTECIYRQKIHSFEQARELLDEYICFYNNERIQFKTKLTPLEKRRQAR